MEKNNFLDIATDLAFAELDKADGNIQELGDPFKTIAIVCSAQGIIDNGGLEYFFENDFPNNPPYQMFIDAYSNIGASTEAECIEKALPFFEVPNPETATAARIKFINSLPEDYSHEFQKISGSICGSEAVWTLLGKYAQQNKILIESRVV
jgi:hypothetical protein